MIDYLEILKATQEAAIACYDFIGKNDEKSSDKAAVDAMRRVLNTLDFKARIVIGEGERDKAPMLYIGEELGASSGRVQYDIAVDPLEGTTICAKAMPGSLSVLAITEHQGMLHAPDVYMDKIASKYPVVDLDDSVANNLKNIANFKKCPVNELTVIILNRQRHQEKIAKTRETGAKLKLISDGDIAAIIEVALGDADLYLGIGGAPEGVLAAAALKTLGGQIMGRLIFADENEKNRAAKIGITDFNKKYLLNDLVSKDVIFCATGVTSGPLLEGVMRQDNKFKTQSIMLSSIDKQVLKIDAYAPHNYTNSHL